MAIQLPHGFVTGKITKTVLAYVELTAGKARADALAQRCADKTNTPVASLLDSEARFHFEVAEAIYPLVVDELKDPDAIYRAGAFSTNMQAVGVFTFGMVRLLGGVKFVYQKVADISPRFANTGTMVCRDVTSTSAILEFTMYSDLRCTVFGCDYRRGLLASVPLGFGSKQPAQLTHTQCQARGDPSEVYALRWT